MAGGDTLERARQRLRHHALRIDLHADQAMAFTSGQRDRAGVGQPLGQYRPAWPAGQVKCQRNRLTGIAGQRQVRRFDRDASVFQPAGQQTPMFQVPGRRGIEVQMICIHFPCDAGQRACQQTVSQHRRRRIGREIDFTFFTGAADRHEHPAPLHAADQPASFQDGVGFGHRAQTDRQLPGEGAVCRQTIASLQLALDNVVSQRQHQPFDGSGFHVGQAGLPGGLKPHGRSPEKVYSVT